MSHKVTLLVNDRLKISYTGPFSLNYENTIGNVFEDKGGHTFLEEDIPEEFGEILVGFLEKKVVQEIEKKNDLGIAGKKYHKKNDDENSKKDKNDIMPMKINVPIIVPDSKKQEPTRRAPHMAETAF